MEKITELQNICQMWKGSFFSEHILNPNVALFFVVVFIHQMLQIQ